MDYAEALKARLAGRNRRLTVIANGGLYATLEITKASRLGSDMMFVQDSGRLAQVVSTLMGTYPLNGDLSSWTYAKDDIERYHVIMAALKMCPRDVAEEFMSKDFGRNEVCANEDEAVFREYFYHMLWTLQNQAENHLLAVPLKHLGQATDQYFTVTIEHDTRYPIKEIYLRKDESDPNNFDEAEL